MTPCFIFIFTNENIASLDSLYILQGLMKINLNRNKVFWEQGEGGGASDIKLCFCSLLASQLLYNLNILDLMN